MLVLSKWILHSMGTHSCGAHSPFSISIFIQLRLGGPLKSSNWCQLPLLSSLSLFVAFPLANKYYDWLLGLPTLTVWSLVLVFLPVSLFLQVLFFFTILPETDTTWEVLSHSNPIIPFPVFLSEFSSFMCSDASILFLFFFYLPVFCHSVCLSLFSPN